MSAAAPAPRLRAAGERDLDRLLGLYELLAEHHGGGPRFRLRGAGDPGLRAHLGARLGDPDARLWVAEEAGQLLGFCLVVRVRRPAFFAESERVEVASLFVQPESRRQGLGAALAEAALLALDPQGRLRVELAVDRDNAAGARFWRSLGFAPAMDVLERHR